MRKQICKLVNIIRPFGFVLHREGDWNAITRRMQVYEKILATYTGIRHLNSPSYSCIIFSKDRALQLHSLLFSLKENIRTPVKLHILYASSSDRHQEAYQQVFDLHKEYLASVVRQINFRDQVLDLLSKIDTNRLFFLVDDIVISREISFDYISTLSTSSFVPSLRMAPHLQYCYTLGKEQPVPAYVENAICNDQFYCWRWSEGCFDWNYPLSLDGHVFDTLEIKTIIENCSFKAPNSLENALQEFRSLFLSRYGICWNESRIINIPLNKVQSENENLCGSVHQEQLLEAWERGLELDYRKFYNFKNVSAHQEVSVSLMER